MSAAAIAIVVIVIIVGLIALAMSVRMVQQYQRGVVFRFGRVLDRVREPGLHLIVPIADRMTKVSMQTTVVAVPPQGAITRDNVTLTVDAVVYFRVIDPVKALVNVHDYIAAVQQVAQTALRSVIGRTELDTLLSDRERVNVELKAAIDAPTERPWGVLVERVEVKDVALPDSMKRSMSRQAEAERERRARVIAADGEYQASTRLADAGRAMAQTPGAFQLRLLQTVVDVAAEKNSTLVMPFPVELLRFFDQLTGAAADRTRTGPDR
jgi:regulator of protease activity HflC (stomatin/prohibitin superfamily)